MDKYLKEEIDYKAIRGPFKQFPIENIPISPFMARPKPNWDRRCVITDLSWPQGASVNYGRDKYVYMGS